MRLKSPKVPAVARLTDSLLFSDTPIPEDIRRLSIEKVNVFPSRVAPGIEEVSEI